MLRPLPAYRVYLLTQAVFALAFMTFTVLASVYRIQVVGLNPFELVLVGTVLEATAFLLETPTGIVADVYSRKLSVIIGFLLFGLGFMLEGLIPTLASVLIAQVIWGAGATFISGALQAWIADELGEQGIGQVYLRGSQVQQAAAIFGIPLAVGLGSVTLGLPLVAAGAILVALSITLIAIMPEQGFRPTRDADHSPFRSMRETFTLGIQTVRGRPVVMMIVLIAVLAGASSEGFDRLAEKHLIDNFSFPALPSGPLDNLVLWFGLIAAAGMLINIGITEIVRRRVNTDDHRALAMALLSTTVLLIFFLVGFALAGSFALAIAGMLAVKTTRMMREPLTTAWLNQSLSSRMRATVISFRNQADALGQIAGGPALGLIATVASLPAAFVVAASILVPALYLYRRTLQPGGVSQPATEAGKD